MDKTRIQQILSHPTAMIVIDMQNDFCHPDGALAKIGEDVSSVSTIIPQLQSLLDELRIREIPVLHVNTTEHAWNQLPSWKVLSTKHLPPICKEGSWGADWFEIVPKKGERVITKSKTNSFVGTELDLVLRCREIRTLIFGGFATNVCVETTARHACCLNYNVLFLEDCTAATSEEEHRGALKNIGRFFGEVLDSQSLIECLDFKMT